jgi:putative signal transducing protein
MVREPDPRLRPEYAQGEMVAVTTVRNVAEAEMVRDMLLGEGIPTMVRPARTSGLTAVDLGTGAHEILVRESGYEAAYQLVHGDPPPEGGNV